MKENFKKALKLFLVFFKIGAFTFGGGYAMVPIIQSEVAEKRGWIKNEDILDILAISESTPGPIAINSATFVGYQVAGVFGSVMATLGVVLPSLIIISIVSYFFKQFLEFKVVKYAFLGIRAGVLALIVKAAKNMMKACPKNAVAYTIVGLAFVLTAVFDINVFVVIIGSAVAGLIYSLAMNKRKGDGK